MVDYRSFTDGKNPQVVPNDSGRKWWLYEPGLEMAQSIVSTVTSLANADAKRQTQYQISARLYGNTNIMGINGLSYSKIQSTQATLKDRVSYNVIQSCVDTLQSKITKNKPKPAFLTAGGSWKIQRQAKMLDKFIDGMFYENDAYELGSSIFKDACVFGDGIVHVFEHHGRCKFERVIASELYVDQMESFYGFPRQIHRVKNVDRAVLMALYPEHKDAILIANPAVIDITGTFQNVADQVTVCESYHLPSGPDAKDGMHVIAIDKAILFKETWTKDYFPFARLSWCPRLYGYWGQGLSEQLQNLQLEINKILWVIQRSMHMAGSFKIFLEHGSKVIKEHLSNDIGVIVNYTGTAPTYVTPPIVPPEVYAHLQTLKMQAFEQAGISMLSATSQKPAGLNSGKALREFNDIETERFMAVGYAYERFFLDLAKLSINTVQDIFEREKTYKIRIPGKHFLEKMDWKEVRLEEDQYVLKIYPVSKLPTDPAGQLQTITEYVQAGFLSPRAGRRLLDFPDLDKAEDLANSQEDYLHKVIEDMIDNGTVYHPEPDDDLALARELALQYIPYAKLNKAPEENVQLLRDFISEIDQLTLPPPMEAPMPLAAPEATPTSELIPNIPAA